MIWILGAGGMLGRALCRRCQADGQAFEAFLKKDLDITQLADLERCVAQKRPSLIINCAAYTDVDGAELEPQKAFAVNALGPLQLGMVTGNENIPLIHISTDYVFDGVKRAPYVETDSTAPVGVYGMSKWEGEQLLLACNPRACVIRTSWLFGEGGKNFVSSMASLMQTKSSLRVIHDQRGRPTYVEDLARVILQMKDKSGLYHFANQEERSRYEMAVDIQSAMAAKGLSLLCQEIIPVSSAEFPTRAPRPSYSVLNTDKIARELNFSPRVWQETLKDYV